GRGAVFFLDEGSDLAAGLGPGCNLRGVAAEEPGGRAHGTASRRVIRSGPGAAARFKPAAQAAPPVGSSQPSHPAATGATRPLRDFRAGLGGGVVLSWATSSRPVRPGPVEGGLR